MTHRTYGETKNCAGCRYWSEMLAHALGGGPVEAMCLAGEGPFQGQYVAGYRTCPSWKSGHYGAVDAPPNFGEETRPLYAREDKRGKRAAGRKAKAGKP